MVKYKIPQETDLDYHCVCREFFIEKDIDEENINLRNLESFMRNNKFLMNVAYYPKKHCFYDLGIFDQNELETQASNKSMSLCISIDNSRVNIRFGKEVCDKMGVYFCDYKDNVFNLIENFIDNKNNYNENM